MRLTDIQWKTFDNFLARVGEKNSSLSNMSTTLLEIAKAYREDSKAARQEVEKLREENALLEFHLDFVLHTNESIKERAEMTLEEWVLTNSDKYQGNL